MKKYIVTIVGYDGPMHSFFIHGMSKQDVYSMYYSQYHTDRHVIYIDVAEIL